MSDAHKQMMRMTKVELISLVDRHAERTSELHGELKSVLEDLDLTAGANKANITARHNSAGQVNDIQTAHDILLQNAAIVNDRYRMVLSLCDQGAFTASDLMLDCFGEELPKKRLHEMHERLKDLSERLSYAACEGDPQLAAGKYSFDVDVYNSHMPAAHAADYIRKANKEIGQCRLKLS